MLRRVLALAVDPMRVRETLPIPSGWLPSASSDKAKAWIYPSEDLALMQCDSVPLGRRLFFGVLAREGMRVSEALGLSWSDVDLVRGVVKLDSNKTEDPRTWALGSDVVAALSAWRKLRGHEARIFSHFALGDRGDFAHHLREGLKLAGVTRTELFVPQPNRLLLRAHDLRGTFVTLALAAGRTEAWVTDRTGHRSSAMIYKYKRAARAATELGLGWFTSLHEAIPELAAVDSR
jgi:integrase